MDKAEVSDILKRQQEYVNSKITHIVTSFNNAERELKDTISRDLKSIRVACETNHNAVREEYDRLRGVIENKLTELEKAQPHKVEIEPQKMVIQMLKDNNLEHEITINAQHERFPDFLLDLKHGHTVYNYGPTGSGKTVAVYTAGKVLNLPVYRKVLNRETSPYIFSGYMKGDVYTPGLAFKPFTEGGILFCDELDNGNANAATSIKEYADADEVYFGDKLYKKHKDFRLVANANTIGNGANASYVGRNQLDKALLNIFKFHFWGYDESFEYEICWKEYLDCGGDPAAKLRFDNFIKSLRDFRRAIAELNILHILSPRNLKQASKDFALGRNGQHIIETIVLKGLDEGQTKKLVEKVKSYYPKKQKAESLSNVWEQ